MGELWVLSERVRFTKLSDIREAYSMAFSEKIKEARVHKIDESLSEKSLDALSLVRNLLVHRAGYADPSYLRQAKSIPHAPKPTKGKRLLLNGELACSLVNPVIDCSIKLIKGVDAWIQCAKIVQRQKIDESKE